MVMKRSREDQAVGSQPPQAPPPTEAQNRAADLQSQDPRPVAPDADGARQSVAREEQIRQAAYEAYLRRAGAAGGELEDWLEAERSIDKASAPAPGGKSD